MDKEIVMIRRQNWLRIINECNGRTSGTKKEWCEANGIQLRKMYYWQRHLRLLMVDQMKEDRRKDSLVPAGGSNGFADITPYIDGASGGVSSSVHTVEGPSQNAGLTIELGDCRILMTGDWEEDSLIRVIRSIRNA